MGEQGEGEGEQSSGQARLMRPASERFVDLFDSDDHDEEAPHVSSLSLPSSHLP